MTELNTHYSLVKFWRADNGNGLREHHLIGAVGMQIHTRQKGCLRGMGLQNKQQIVVISYTCISTFFYNLLQILG